MAFVAAFVGLKGGVGRTTLVANLASVLTQRGRRVVAIDLDSQNGLYLHFGIEAGSVTAICMPADPTTRAPSRGGRAREGADQPCVPFAWGDHRAADEVMEVNPDWLGHRVEALQPTGCEIVLLDTPSQATPWLKQALESADVVVSVITPDTAAYATLPATEALLHETRGDRSDGLGAFWLVNRFDGTDTLGRDVLSSLRGALKTRVLPMVIHEDLVVREALARQRTLVVEPGDSQVLADLGQLAEWVADRALRANAPRSGRSKTGITR